MAMVTMAAVVALAAEETTQSVAQHLTDERHGKTSETEHCAFPFC